jgi:hypothetical protein
LKTLNADLGRGPSMSLFNYSITISSLNLRQPPLIKKAQR